MQLLSILTTTMEVMPKVSSTHISQHVQILAAYATRGTHAAGLLPRHDGDLQYDGAAVVRKAYA